MKPNTLFTVRRSHRAMGMLIAVLTLALVVFAAPFAQAAPAAQSNVLRLGYLGPANSGTARGAQLAINQINSIGGVTALGGESYRLELVVTGSQPTVETIADDVDTLVRQNVAVILGPDSNTTITPDTLLALASVERPVLTPATGDALTDVDQSDFIFRTRAPERVYGFAVVDYLVNTQGLTDIAAVLTEVEFSEALDNFKRTLNNAGGQLVAEVVEPANSDTLLDRSGELISQNPEAIVMWGNHQDAAALLEALRDAGWRGVFAYRYAQEAARAGVLSDELANGVIGFNSWTIGDDTPASRIFLRDYVVSFGAVPGPRAVAAYDAIWLLRNVIQNNGIDPFAMKDGFLAVPPQTLVQGVLHPIEFISGDLSRNGVVYQLGPHGGSIAVVARVDDIRRLDGTGGGGVPEGTPEVVATNTPSGPVNTPVPTATLEGTWLRVTANVLNVRNGPGFNYAKIGEVKLDEQYRVLGAIADYTWLVIDFNGGVGWVKTEFAELIGDLGDVSIIAAPPTPTPANTATPTLPPQPDLVIDTVTLNPAQPVPGVAFTATITLRNAGGVAASGFSVAASWLPGDVFSSAFVNGLAAGQTAQAQLTATVTGTGVYQVAVVADLNQEVAEFNESNNYLVSYRVDQPVLVQQNSVQIGANTSYNLDGSSNDFLWDGYNIGMLNSSEIAQLFGITFETSHYDLLNPGILSYDTTGFGTDKVLNGALFGFITDEGHWAVIRVDNVQAGGNIILTYRVYNAP